MKIIYEPTVQNPILYKAELWLPKPDRIFVGFGHNSIDAILEAEAFCGLSQAEIEASSEIIITVSGVR